jgi:hypothetical protein
LGQNRHTDEDLEFFQGILIFLYFSRSTPTIFEYEGHPQKLEEWSWPQADCVFPDPSTIFLDSRNVIGDSHLSLDFLIQFLLSVTTFLTPFAVTFQADKN